MANEIEGVTGTGQVCDALVVSAAGQFWNTASLAFEDFVSGNYADYLIVMTETGTTGIYRGNFPSGITSSGTYKYFVKRRADVAAAQDDPIISTGTVDWTGSSSAAPGATGGMSGSDWRSYVLRGGFKRTDKDTELYEETTDAIQEMRREFMFAEAEVETETTDTIATLGDYRIDVESDFGLLLGVTVIDGQNGTALIPKTKKEFDELYPDISATQDRGYPKHFCLFAGQIQIGPIPSSTDFEYRKAYSRRAGTVTSSTTSVPFTSEYRDVLRDLVQAKLYKGLDEFDKAAAFRAEYDRGMEKSETRERRNKGKGLFNVTPYGM